MCPMCDRAIGEDPPAVCPRCGWELVELDEGAAWLMTLEGGTISRLIEAASQTL